MEVSFRIGPKSTASGLVASQNEKSILRVATEVLTVCRARLGIQFHAFPLDPGVEPSGVLRQQRMRLRYGSKVRRPFIINLGGVS